MLIAVGCLTLLALATLAFAHGQQRTHQEAEAQWGLERRELLNRIQAPERLPVDEVRTFPDPEPEIDMGALVGTISYDEPEEDE